MKTLTFAPSKEVSLGLEIELQLIDPRSFSLISRATDLIRLIKKNKFQTHIKPEITQSMIELNSSIHHSPKEMFDELLSIQEHLLTLSNELDIAICGGGTHPFQKWSMQKIFPEKRYKNLSRQYRYLSKRATVFGQHIHVGCANAEDAIYLAHAMARYVPQFIAMSASSPFYQGVDTGYFSSRISVFNAFPLSGVMPFVTSWEEFSAYYYKMRKYGIIGSMKDFYWDIRPKPEFGTVEIRVFDTPLTLKKSIMLVAYVQALARYLLQEKPFKPSPDLYFLYQYNRFQASRYGYDGIFVNPETGENLTIGEDIQQTIKKMEQHANYLNVSLFIAQMMGDIIKKSSDSTLLRNILKQNNSLPKVVEEQCKLWSRG